MKSTDRGGKFLAFLVCVVLLAGSLSVSALADEFAATTMKLASAEGTVKVTNGLGRSIKTFAGMNLNNGYHVVTDTKSRAKISLRSTPPTNRIRNIIIINSAVAEVPPSSIIAEMSRMGK